MKICPLGEELLVAFCNFAAFLQTNKIYCFGVGIVQEV